MSILETIDGTLRDYATSADAMRWAPEGKRAAFPATDIEVVIADMARFGDSFRAAVEAARPVIEAHAKTAGRMIHAINRALDPAQHERCVTCHPWRKPKPLAVDGREYQRRLKARRRRRR